MRLLAVALLVAHAAVAAAAPTVWNVEVAALDGARARMTFLDGNPNTILRSCRCVAGRWRLAGESATHFAGTLEVRSENHARRTGKRIGAKVRKTRAVMYVQQAYRDALHDVLRGTGSVVLREVQGGEWEVVAFADAPIGDLFATYRKWRAQGTPKPARPSPLLDPKADAAALAKLINDYRASIGLPRVAISPALTKVAQAHVRDLAVNKPVTDRCNMHSWSKRGRWSACCYDSSRAAARCMWNKPKEIAGYAGNGYEIAARSSGITPAHALELWQQSPAHHHVMINHAQWKKPWRAMGVAIEGDYAVAWFGELPDKRR
jgi:hypothetical protein